MSKRRLSKASSMSRLEVLYTRILRNNLGYVEEKIEQLKENARRDGVRVNEISMESDEYGEIYETESEWASQSFPVWINGKRTLRKIPVEYDININDSLSSEVKLATLVHELGHLYCGHIGTLDEDWWPDRRRRLDYEQQEVEAESVAMLVCKYFDLHVPHQEYLADDVEVRSRHQFPRVKIRRLIGRSADLIQEMCEDTMDPRDFDRLYIDVMLLDGMIAFLVPEYEETKDIQNRYSPDDLRRLGMKGPIGGYWHVQAGGRQQWRSITNALEAFWESGGRSREIEPTEGSWENIDQITKRYEMDRSGGKLNIARKATPRDIQRFERLRTNGLGIPDVRIHTYVQGQNPGLIAWKGRYQKAANRLQHVEYRKGTPMPWKEVRVNFFYKIVEDKAKAEEFLKGLERPRPRQHRPEGWKLYGYKSREKDIRQTLKQLRMSRTGPIID